MNPVQQCYANSHLHKDVKTSAEFYRFLRKNKPLWLCHLTSTLCSFIISTACTQAFECFRPERCRGAEWSAAVQRQARGSLGWERLGWSEKRNLSPEGKLPQESEAPFSHHWRKNRKRGRTQEAVLGDLLTRWVNETGHRKIRASSSGSGKPASWLCTPWSPSLSCSDPFIQPVSQAEYKSFTSAFKSSLN